MSFDVTPTGPPQKDRPPSRRRRLWDFHMGRSSGPVFSDLAPKDDTGQPHCPACGGVQFKAVRSAGQKVWWGAFSLLFPADAVECVTCGRRWKRG